METDKEPDYSEMLSKTTFKSIIESAARKKIWDSFIDNTKTKIAELNGDVIQILAFLNSKKNEIDEQRMHWRIKRKPEYEKLYQTITYEVIDPYLEFYKSRLKNPDIKKEIVETTNNNFPDEKLKPSLIELSEKKIILPLPENFSQITYSEQISKEELISDFMLLHSEKNPVNEEPFMTEKDVIELLEKNYTIFECKNLNGKYIPINLLEDQIHILCGFVYYIYYKYEKKHRGTKKKYANFLIHNFLLFKPQITNTLVTNIRNIDTGFFQKLKPRIKK